MLSIVVDFDCCFLLLFELDPILIFLLLSVFVIFGDDLKLIEKDVVCVETIFVNKEQSIILYESKNTS